MGCGAGREGIASRSGLLGWSLSMLAAVLRPAGEMAAVQTSSSSSCPAAATGSAAPLRSGCRLSMGRAVNLAARSVALAALPAARETWPQPNRCDAFGGRLRRFLDRGGCSAPRAVRLSCMSSTTCCSARLRRAFSSGATISSPSVADVPPPRSRALCDWAGLEAGDAAGAWPGVSGPREDGGERPGTSHADSSSCGAVARARGSSMSSTAPPPHRRLALLSRQVRQQRKRAARMPTPPREPRQARARASAATPHTRDCSCCSPPRSHGAAARSQSGSEAAGGGSSRAGGEVGGGGGGGGSGHSAPTAK
mmetsp:Transcript_8704/g.27582  ORF Transcript_8704/g.27582 Transcript_8704/m.27582 type:complete len:309 (-) Transcript_8704:1441-2367(-)